MGQLYSSMTRWDKNIVEIIHIYRDIAILLLDCDQQDTKLE